MSFFVKIKFIVYARHHLSLTFGFSFKFLKVLTIFISKTFFLLLITYVDLTASIQNYFFN